MHTLYTIGLENFPSPSFYSLLSAQKISLIVDVRSNTESRIRPDFNRDIVLKNCDECNIDYIYMGHLLGEQPKEKGWYHENLVDYTEYVKTPKFTQGCVEIIRLLNERPLVLLGVRHRPQDCHRAVLIVRELLHMDRSIKVVHLLSETICIEHDEILEQMRSSLQIDGNGTGSSVNEYVYNEYAKKLALDLKSRIISKAGKKEIGTAKTWEAIWKA